MSTLTICRHCGKAMWVMDGMAFDRHVHNDSQWCKSPHGTKAEPRDESGQEEGQGSGSPSEPEPTVVCPGCGSRIPIGTTLSSCPYCGPDAPPWYES